MLIYRKYKVLLLNVLKADVIRKSFLLRRNKIFMVQMSFSKTTHDLHVIIFVPFIYAYCTLLILQKT